MYLDLCHTDVNLRLLLSLLRMWKYVAFIVTLHDVQKFSLYFLKRKCLQEILMMLRCTVNNETDMLTWGLSIKYGVICIYISFTGNQKSIFHSDAWW